MRHALVKSRWPRHVRAVVAEVEAGGGSAVRVEAGHCFVVTFALRGQGCRLCVPLATGRNAVEQARLAMNKAARRAADQGPA